MSSNLPSLRRFKFEDYKDAPQWFSNFLQSLNLFVNPVYDILNGRITNQNLVAPRIYTTAINAATPTLFNFTNPLSVQPSAVLLGNVYIPPNFNIHPTSVTQVLWHTSNNVIFIDDVLGLTPGIKYSLTLVVF